MKAVLRVSWRLQVAATCYVLVSGVLSCRPSGPPYCDGDKLMRYSSGHVPGSGSWRVGEDCKGYECRDSGYDEWTGHCILRDVPACADRQATFCRDNTIFSCERDQIAVRTTDCGDGFCHEDEGSAFCSSFNEESPECETEGHYSVCADDKIITCLGSLKVEEETCDPSEYSGRPRFCVDWAGEKHCSLSPESESACHETGKRYACFESLLVQCVGGMPIREIECKDQCIDRPDGALCVEGATDSRCPENGRPGVCDGNRALSCADGYLLSDYRCPEGEVCVVQDCAAWRSAIDKNKCDVANLESFATCYSL